LSELDIDFTDLSSSLKIVKIMKFAFLPAISSPVLLSANINYKLYLYFQF